MLLLKFFFIFTVRNYFCRRFNGYKGGDLSFHHQRPGSVQYENEYNTYQDITLTDGVNIYYQLPDGEIVKSEYKVIILLDSDAYGDAIKLYKKLNSTKLHNRVFIIKLPKGYDISDINQRLGKKGVLNVLSTAKKIKESLLY